MENTADDAPADEAAPVGSAASGEEEEGHLGEAVAEVAVPAAKKAAPDELLRDTAAQEVVTKIINPPGVYA